MSSLLDKLAEVGALINDSHVVYTSGKHGPAYVNITRALNHPNLARWLGEEMARMIKGIEFDTLVSPVHSDDKLGPAISFGLMGHGRTVHPVYAQELTESVLATVDGVERELEVVTGDLFFPRQQEDFVRDRDVVVVGDVLTTGGTTEKVINLVEGTQGKVKAIVIACNRSKHKDTFQGVPLLSLMTVPMKQWEEGECQACIEQVAINTTVGHGAQWLEQHPDPEQWPAYMNAKAA